MSSEDLEREKIARKAIDKYQNARNAVDSLQNKEESVKGSTEEWLFRQRIFLRMALLSKRNRDLALAAFEELLPKMDNAVKYQQNLMTKMVDSIVCVNCGDPNTVIRCSPPLCQECVDADVY